MDKNAFGGGFLGGATGAAATFSIMSLVAGPALVDMTGMTELPDLCYSSNSSQPDFDLDGIV